jgi:tRNA-2-methylthio-N6-dimethylallyladenosine synthase
MSKYWLITYGCQMNRSDSERIATVLESSSYQPAMNEDGADLIVVNACSVRQSAIDRIWGQTQKFKKLKIKNNGIKTVLTGCILKKDRNKFNKVFDLIFNIRDLQKLPQLLSKSGIYDLKVSNYLKITPKYQFSFSAFLPIMTGCNNFCTFCVVPYTRGREISRSAKEILCEVENLAKRDYTEIWLLGQNVNSYRYGEINFSKLLRMVNNIPGNFWIRFMSSHPKDFSSELIETMVNCEKVTEYLNLPIQSGDDEILKKMNRPYNIGQYKETIRKIREGVPNISLSTDVIVGFPGEMENNFQNTVRLFREIKFDMAYIAQFSPRPGTAAFELKDSVSHQEKERRWRILTDTLRETALEKNKNYLGKEIEVLVEKDKNGCLLGKTKNYKTVKFRGDSNLVGQFTKVQITQALPWGLKGESKNGV